MNQENSPKLSKYFGYGFLLMALTGIVFIIRDQVDDKNIYNILVVLGFTFAYTGFAICVISMFKYWIDIYKSLRNKRNK